jgi:hypothetical protein
VEQARRPDLCLQEGLSCNAVAQGLLTSEECAELDRLGKENRELRREKDDYGWRQRTLPWPERL